MVAWRVEQKPPHANVKKRKQKLHWLMLLVISCGSGKLSRNRKSTTDGELNPKSMMHGMTPGNRWVLNRTEPVAGSREASKPAQKAAGSLV